MYYEVGAKQIQGGRDYQEDSFQVFFPETSELEKHQVLVVLADGMGGHAGGAVASEMVVEALIEEVSDPFPEDNYPVALYTATEIANRAVQAHTRERPELQGMGCTLVAFTLQRGTLHWLSVGDSLLYVIRNGEVIRKNDDHSYGGYMDKLVAVGEQIPETPGFTPRRNMLMSYINGEEIAMIDCPEQGFRLFPGDRLIVASDGLDTVSSDEFPYISKSAVTAQEFADGLIAAVDAAGKKNQDNTTVVVVDVIGSPGDDTTQNTPGDWAGETLSSLDDSEQDITIQPDEADLDLDFGEEEVGDKESPAELQLETEAEFVVNENPPEQPLVEPPVKPALVSPPTQDIAQVSGKKGVPIIVIGAVLAFIVIVSGGYFYFIQPSGGPARNESVTKTSDAEVLVVPASNEQRKDTAPDKKAADKPFEPEIIQDRIKSGGLGPELVVLAAGSFLQGSSSLSTVFEERPQREVQLQRFAISVTEVTFAQYDAFVSAAGGQQPMDQNWGRNFRPVINVSWDDARAYAAWLSSQTGHRYRLPTESEWEYAARAGTSKPFWWGRKAGHNQANCWGCGSDWDGVKTAPVGSFSANPWGLQDTSGNVLEWVADCMHKNYKNAPTDGSSWAESGCSQRVVRGGAWSNPADSSRVAKRLGMRADVRQDNLGFRLVRELN